MSMIEIAIQRTSNMMIDVFEDSLRESLTEYLSPELAKQIFEDVFNRAKDKSYERKLASEKRLEEVSNEAKEEP